MPATDGKRFKRKVPRFSVKTLVERLPLLRGPGHEELFAGHPRFDGCMKMYLPVDKMNRKQANVDSTGKPPVKVLEGRHHPDLPKWERFDRLQRSLRPLRKGKHPKKGIHYGAE